MTSLLLLQIITGAIAGLLVLGLAVHLLQRWDRRRSGFGLSALDNLTSTPRPVNARVVRLPDVTRGWGSGFVHEAAFTVLSVPHDGLVDEAFEYAGPDADRVDRIALGLPESQERGPGPELGTDELAFIRGIVRVERDKVRFIEAGDLLEPGYLRAVAAQLLRLARQAEQPRPLWQAVALFILPP
jgi:hypothetical protein